MLPRQEDDVGYEACELRDPPYTPRSEWNRRLAAAEEEAAKVLDWEASMKHDYFLDLETFEEAPLPIEPRPIGCSSAP